MKILVLGASGMLGSAVYRVFGASDRFEVFGTLRTSSARTQLGESGNKKLITGVDVENSDSLNAAFGRIRPDVVINCVGVIKQLESAKSPLITIPINALLPHRLQALCQISDARLIHVSTDCVFTGKQGMYKESDRPDATDLYGVSKLLGEVTAANAITIRTSIIGEELSNGANGLVGWFLNQSAGVKGYRKAIFSGLPTLVLARIMRDVIIDRPQMSGLYQVSADPINKFDLLRLVNEIYGKNLDITPDDALVIDRSLDSTRFREETGFQFPAWPQLIQEMRSAQG